MNSAARFALQTIGFVVGASVAFAAEILIFMALQAALGVRARPVGLGLIFFPIAAGIGAAHFFASPITHAAIVRMSGGIRALRIYGAVVAAWFLVIFGWIVLANPYRYRMYDEDWVFLAKLGFVPPALLFVALSIFRQAMNSAPPATPPKKEKPD